MPIRDIKAIIFDCDGTLVDSETLSLRILIELVAEFGLKISHEEAMARFAGNELSVVLREIEDRLGNPLPEDFLLVFRDRQIAELKQNLLPFDGAEYLLSRLQLPFCVASNAPLSKIDVCLTTTGLKRFFDDNRIFSAYQIEKWKPAPDLFLLAAAEMNVSPDQCAVVEDSHFGIAAGLAAGMQVWAYRPVGATFEPLNKVREVRHLNDLVEVFSGARLAE